MPWHDPEDLAWFRQETMGSTIIFGMATMLRLPHLPGREVVPDNPLVPPGEFLERFAGQGRIFVGGGAKTYARYLPFVRRSFITRVDYDGDADVWMPALWPPAPAR